MPAGSLVLAALLAAALAPPRTLRVDYFHTGGASEERFALDRVVLEGPWPGRLDRGLDDTNLGLYRFEVVDLSTQRVLYSRGFASMYGEWETTVEARERCLTLHESVRFPEPEAPVQVLLKKRGSRLGLREVWSLVVDPADPAVDRTGPPASSQVWAVMENGAPSDKVDLLLLGDGYTEAEMEKWRRDAKRLTETLFAVSPFKEQRTAFNVWAIDTPSQASGVARPSDGIHRRSALRVRYDAFGSERYALAFDNLRLREAAAAAPYEFLVIVVNERKYGGGGIHNQYTTVAADNRFAPYIMVHEFGHHFAGLADEYYASPVAFVAGAERLEPWEWNVTADPKRPKWADLIGSGTPLPTPWPKQAFEEAQREIQTRRLRIRAEGQPEERMEELFQEERERMTRLLASAPHAGAVGAFEGAMYQANGYYRSQSDCIMFTRDEVGFCAACRRAIERVIDMYATR